MKGSTWTLTKNELRGYFDHPTAYLLAVAFLVLSLFLTFRTLYASGAASLRPFFDLLPILFAVFIPAATMRSFAEERRSGTLEWLNANPLQESEVVAGKFLGDWFFVLLTLAGSLPMALSLLLVSEADPGIIVAQYLGAALLAGQLVALGLWASSMTRNQISAFIVAAGLSFLLFLIGLPVVQIGLPPFLSGALARLSLVSHFQNVARGVVDLRDVLYFVSTGALFLALTLAVLTRDRLSHGRPDYKRLRLGTALAAVFVLLLNLLGGHIRGRMDLTRDNLFTLASGSRDILRELDDLVQIKLFASNELPPELQLQLRDVRDLLSDFRKASSGNLLVEESNPDENEAAREEASSLGIMPVEFNVLRDDEFQIKRGYYGLAVLYADEQEVIPVIQRTDDLEFRLASSIRGMTDQSRPGIAFLQGFGAKGGFELQGLRSLLNERYTVRTIQMAPDSTPEIGIDSTEVVVLAGPTQAMDSLSLKRVGDFVESGGGAMVLLEPILLDPQSPQPIPAFSGLDPMLEEWGLRFNSSLVADLASSEQVSLGQRGFFNVIAPYPLWPIVSPAGDHITTRSLTALSLSWSGALEIIDSASVTPLWQTTEAGILRPPNFPILPDQNWDAAPSEMGVRTVAAAVDPGAAVDGEEGASPSQGRLIVVGDASFLDPQFTGANQQNVLFAANAIDWLAQDESLIRIRSKNRTPPALAFTSDFKRNAMKWGNLAGVPLLFIALGLMRVTGRRRRAEARWKEVIS
ncbi:MAG: Gldg family protein [Gemmatimonadota bacterium]|jgi:ABC-2 type transport system permease protein